MARTGNHRKSIAALAALWLLLPACAAAQAVPAGEAGEENGALQAETAIGQKQIRSQDAPDEPVKIKSLFYSQDEVRDIHLAINTYLKHVNNREDLTFDEEAFLRRLRGLKTNSPSRFYTYPQFFLDSLVYHGANDWLIWLNGKKITQNTPVEGATIHVVGIDAEKVTLEWLPVVMERVLEVWNQIPNDEVTVDQLRGKVVFTLHPNQTFSSYVMKVLEGKVLPVTVDASLIESSVGAANVKKEPKEAGNEAPAAPPGAAASPDSSDREGLSGLINRYQNLKQERAP